LLDREAVFRCARILANFIIFDFMARIELDIPSHLPFVTRMPVRVTDLNYANHLSNDALLGMAHEARMRWFHHHGYTEIDAEGVSFIMADCAIVYKSEGFYGQELTVSVGVGDYSRVSFDIFYRFELEKKGKVVAEVKTGLVCFDYDARKVRSVPTALKEAFGDVRADESPQ